MERPPQGVKVFSRGNSPPIHQLSLQHSGPPQPAPSAPPPQPQQPLHQPMDAPSGPQHLDALFRNIGIPPISQQQAPPQPPPYVPMQTNTASSTPLSVGSAAGANANAANNERQNALLSTLMGTVAPNLPPGPPPYGPQVTQRPPSPQGSIQSVQRPGQSPMENPGQMLLDQLMAGTAPKPSNLPQGPIAQPVPSIPTPPNLTPDLERGLHQPPSLPPSPRQLQQAPRQAPRAPSPVRKSMFDFVSPFDALSTPPKKKPVPPVAQPPGGLSSSSGGEVDPPSPLIDPRRKSMENLLQDMTKGPPPAQQEGTPKSKAPAKVAPGSPPQRFPLQPVQSAPLPPTQTAPRDSSPSSRPAATTTGSWKGPKNGPAPRTGGGNKNGQGPVNVPSGAQTVVFDVSQPMETTLAHKDHVLSTAIALLKIDSVFIPGCTIGVTTWVAYAMTRGRVRVIGRANGERTLLQLPPLFPQTTTVIDMVVFGNRLAAVTSDGGFVIWEVPRIVEDDVNAKLLLCVVPPQEGNALKVVKWHPKQADTLAVGSDKEIFLINVLDAINIYHGEPISQAELPRIGTVFSLVSPLVSFAFDTANYAITSISEDSTLTAWNIMDKLPAWSNRIPGEGIPSSIDVIDGGIVLGRKQGTILQLLPVYSKEILSTVKFVNGKSEDPDMFGHVTYDQRIRTLWVANSRRESLIALRVSFDSAPSPGGKREVPSGRFEQLVEFPGLKPTIHFVVLSADADPTGEEAEAACVAAKLDPGPLALVAYSVHAHGVDQVLIRKEWFDAALANPSTQLPGAPVPLLPREYQLHHPQPIPLHQNPLAQHPAPAILPAPPRSPPSNSDDVDADGVPANDARFVAEGKGPKAGKDKGKGKQTKQAEIQDKAPAPDKGAVGPSANVDANASGADVVLGGATKEIRRMEENLYSRLGRLMTKELDKQQQRQDEHRAAEKVDDFTRQEKILKLISTELTKNTTRVVEAAVKTVVQNSVLPALETITKTEVKAALNGQIAKGLSDSMNQTLPNEIERLLLRPDVANHVARTFSSTVTPLIERHVKEAITKTLIPAYMQQSEGMQQDLSRELHAEILNVKKEVITWQSEALKGQEALIREMEQSIKTLSEQVKFMTMNINMAPPMPQPQSYHHVPHRVSPGPPTGGPHNNVPPHMRTSSHGASQPPPQSYPISQGPFAPPPPMNSSWFPPNVPSHPPSLPPQPPSQPQASTRDGNSQEEDWDELYLRVLGLQDTRQLRELLGRSNPDLVMPLNSPAPLSQAVILTLIHRVAGALGEISSVDEFFKTGLWWMQRAVTVLNANDPLISPYVGRVLPAVQTLLSTTRNRLNILPVPPSLDTVRSMTELQDMISRKIL